MLSATGMLTSFKNSYQLGDAKRDDTHQAFLQPFCDAASTSGVEFVS